MVTASKHTKPFYVLIQNLLRYMCSGENAGNLWMGITTNRFDTNNQEWKKKKQRKQYRHEAMSLDGHLT